ncbi:mucin-5AC isoform X2 [Topomyia yanbarensis]|uniref:mucin-5AC isoform X2 n=1 Tax=Topomyia yanbarensis TaxID=2498891 RepID=UPI00273BEBAC|nr:mucin-5AC isoform X2 [Topomyia yanbarensis]XP_058823820.1 mucin-5AC isoform X2 [Topomyia yanbarensis]
MMADTNCSGTSAGTAPITEVIPQWKKELIQRRKNLAKTIGAAATQVHDSASTVAAALTTPTTPRAGPGGVPFGSGQKDPSVEAPSIAESTTPPASTVESPASPTPSIELSSNNSDSPASPTAAVTSPTLFGAPVFVGHSHSSPVNEQPQVLVKSFSGTTNTPSSATRGTTEVLLVGGTSAEKQPLHTQSHSNDGTESTSASSSANSRSNHLPSSALSGSPKGGGGAPANSGPSGKYAVVGGISASASSVDCELTRPAPGETNSYSSSEIGWKLKKNTSSASSSVSPNSSSSTKMVAASAEEIIYEKNRFVGAGIGGETGAPVDVDTSEELKYGPGIVSKLRCRYLSLALRQSANKQRPSLNSMRRATSLNNLLDEESEDLSEREQSIDGKDQSHDKHYQQGKFGREQQQNQMNLQLQQKAKTPDEYISTFQKSVQNSYTRSGRQTEKKNEYNRYNKQRGADSLKRARSVEALVRYDHKAWERDIQKENLYSSNDSNVIILDEICTNGTTTANGNSNNINNCQLAAMNKAELIVDCVTIEEKIINGREKGDPKPKRLTSFIDADERPPPDVVRQTMKIFEANANRRGRPTARTNGAAGEVAAKVASYKSIISLEKPPITHPKPPLSPKKPNIIPRNTSPKSNGNTTTSNTANGLKEKPNLPKLDITAIRYNLETTNNLKNSATSPVQTPPSAGSNPNNTSTPLSVRVEPVTAYRLKYDSPVLSPNTAQHNKVSATTTTTTTNRPESPRFSTTAVSANMQNSTTSTAHTFVDSPSIQALTSKLNNLNIATSTPTSTRSPTPSDSAVPTVAPPQVPPRNILQYATSDEEDPDDPEDLQREYSINSDHGSDSQSDDLELDDEPDQIKKVSRTTMENISKAGVTTQFRFNGQSQNKSHLPSLTTSNSSSNSNGSNSTAAAGGGAKLIASKRLNIDDHLSSNSSSTSSSPITVPTVPSAAVVTQKPPVPLSRESLAANGHKSAATINSIGSSVTANHNLNNLNSSNANTSVNSNGSKVVINANVGGNGNANGESDNAAAPTAAVAAVGAAVSANSSVSSDVKTVNLTAREIEKNQINLEKSSEESISATSSATGANVVVVSKANNNNSSAAGSEVGAGVGTAAATTTTAGPSSGGDFFMAKWGTPTVAAGAAAATTTSAAAASPVTATTNNNNINNPLLVPIKKKVKAPPPPPIEANTMVFNFSDRKDVPDYIENDGIILRPRPRELPKPGESGFVVLGDLTLETSTDPDDSWALGPPSPCDVEFENANVVINGKSSMRNKTSRDNKFKIQFDDSLTSTFEYPSETSMLDTNGFEDDSTCGAKSLGLLDAAANSQPTGGSGGAGVGAGGLAFADNGLLSHKNNLLSSMPLGSAPFASYTPVKAAIDTNFELGVTRTPSPSSTASSTSSSSIANSELHPHQQQQSHHHMIHPSNGSQQSSSNGTGLHLHQQQQQQQQQQRQHLHQQQQQSDRINGGGTDGLLLLNGEAGEPESIQYLKPASDEQTVNWSQGTRVTDLLF